MSARYPIIAVTGSSGAGTSTISRTFGHIFRREGIRAACVEGDAFHRYSRSEMQEKILAAELRGERGPSHFGIAANLFDELEALFAGYAETGQGLNRRYLHDTEEALHRGLPPGSFTPWEALPEDSELLFYEGLHGGVVTDKVDVARHVDLLIGVVPTINLEWIQKLMRDMQERGHSLPAVQDTILRRMDDYVHTIVPQFSRTHINFQRVPIVDTSNPFAAKDVPLPNETLVVVSFRNPAGVNFPELLTLLHGSWMTRPNTLVMPGPMLELGLQVILLPRIKALLEKRAAAQHSG
ncbi:phosphoribulokinase [Uliginosibacterium sp. TH139]|uniref:phosphoribulokinase n=1 Tax=Uliginosibacterium sp. TH139 TaxID=2067453 RepID=UPI000C7CD38C|nr:phosphoribulokinase [Uliginosibacterium sp. TH139]PLK49399.1 phosphoribulokinase [Uliginosibacterium sp. TH139]